jgi:hypothetical protein
MRVDDVVAELELDVLDLTGRFELVYEGYLFSCLWRNGVLLFFRRPSVGPDSSL